MQEKKTDKRPDSSSLVTLASVLARNEIFVNRCTLEHEDDKELFLFFSSNSNLTPEEKNLLEGLSGKSFSVKDDLLKQLAELSEENRKLQELALTDPLTGLYNFRFFEKQLGIEIKRTRRTGMPFSLMMLDVDNFKLLNDRLGHQEGNALLVAVAAMFRADLRPTDIACRFGGDEFSVLMPSTHMLDALLVARRLREAMLGAAGRYELAISFSIGIAEYSLPRGTTGRELVERADAALYAAKKGGKNRIFCEQQPETAAAPDEVSPDERQALLGKKKTNDRRD